MNREPSDTEYVDEDVSQEPPGEDAVRALDADQVDALQLSPDDMEDFARCETIIRDGLLTFFEVGRALEQIRSNRWYQARGYSNFEAYCQSCWGISRQRASQLILAASAMAELILKSEELSTVVDSSGARISEKAIRPLLSIADEKLRVQAFDAALRAARDQGKAPTSVHTEAAVRAVNATQAAPTPTSSQTSLVPAGERLPAVTETQTARSVASIPPRPVAVPPVTPATPATPRTPVKIHGPRYQYWGEYQFDGDAHKTGFQIVGQMIDGELLFEIFMDGIDFSQRPPAILTTCQRWLEEAIAAEDIRRRNLRRAG